jgi:hypothetical protein
MGAICSWSWKLMTVVAVLYIMISCSHSLYFLCRFGEGSWSVIREYYSNIFEFRSAVCNLCTKNFVLSLSKLVVPLVTLQFLFFKGDLKDKWRNLIRWHNIDVYILHILGRYIIFLHQEIVFQFTMDKMGWYC